MNLPPTASSLADHPAVTALRWALGDETLGGESRFLHHSTTVTTRHDSNTVEVVTSLYDSESESDCSFRLVCDLNEPWTVTVNEEA